MTKRESDPPIRGANGKMVSTYRRGDRLVVYAPQPVELDQWQVAELRVRLGRYTDPPIGEDC